MLFMVKVTLPVEAGNAAARKDGLAVIPRILAQQKPEAAYFLEERGERTGLFFLQMNDASEIPAIAEPWFLALNARVEFHPVMRPEDLQKAMPAIERAAAAFA